MQYICHFDEYIDRSVYTCWAEWIYGSFISHQSLFLIRSSSHREGDLFLTGVGGGGGDRGAHIPSQGFLGWGSRSGEAECLIGGIQEVTMCGYCSKFSCFQVLRAWLNDAALRCGVYIDSDPRLVVE